MRTFLVWLVLACLLPGMLGAVVLLVRDYREGRAQLAKDTLQTVRALSQVVDSEILRAQALAQGLVSSGLLNERDLAQFYRAARQTLAESEIGSALSLADASGRQLVNTARDFGQPLPAHGNPDLVGRVFETGRPAVSDLFVSAVSRRPIVAVGVPVKRNGNVAYVATLSIPPDRFNDILRAQALPSDWTATILDASGTIVARTRAAEEFLGTKATPTFVEKYMAADETVFENTTKDGIPVLSIYTRSRDTRWGIAIGIPRANLEAALIQNLKLLALGVACLFTVGLALAWIMAARISGSIRGLVAPALSLGAGEKVSLPPVAVREAAEVSAALADAARLLGERTAALQHANSQIEFLIRNSPANIAVFDRDMRCLAASLRWANTFGVDDAKPSGKPDCERAPDLPHAWEKAHQRGLAGETVIAEAAPWVRSDGSVRLCNWEIWPWREESGAVGGIVITVEDVTERKTAEERIRASEEKYRTLFSNMAEGFCLGELIRDAQGVPVDFRLLEVNDSFCRESGLPPDVVGRPAKEYVPRLEHYWFEAYCRVVEHGDAVRFENYNADTQRHYDLCAFRPSPGHFALVFRDVTEIKALEQSLRHREEDLRQLVAEMPAMVWTTNGAGAVDFVSRQWLDFTGTTTQSQLGAGFLDVIHPDDRENISRRWSDAVASLAQYDAEYRLRRHDGTYRWAKARSSPVQDENGRIRRWLGVTIEIDDLKQTQQALRTLETRYRRLCNANLIGVAVSDATANVVEANDYFLDLIGYSRKEFEAGRVNWRDVTPSEWASTDAVALAEMAAKGVCRSYEKEYLRRDGSRRTVLIFAAGLLEEAGAHIALVLDVTERRRAEQELDRINADLERQVNERTEQLVRAQKLEAIGQLTGGVAHDFNNVLQALASGLFVIERHVPAGAPRTVFEAAKQSIDSGTRLTQAMLAFARRQTLVPEPVNLRQLFDGVGPLLERTLGGLIRVTFKVQPGTPAALVDRSQLESAVLNLALNARDAMPAGGVLALRAAKANVRQEEGRYPVELQPGAYVVVSVEDSGAGMDSQTLSHAFEPFFTTKAPGKGSGLGLSMVHGMAAQSGGAVTIDSELGVGTTVKLFLPCATAAVAEEPRLELAPKAGDGSMVLLVDDNDMVRKALTVSLEVLGYRVQQANSGAAALKLLAEAGNMDVLVTDYAMPGMTGAELAQRVRHSAPDLPVLLITGYSERPHEIERMTVLQKPFGAGELAAALAALLASSLRNDTPDAT